MHLSQSWPVGPHGENLLEEDAAQVVWMHYKVIRYEKLAGEQV